MGEEEVVDVDVVGVVQVAVEEVVDVKRRYLIDNIRLLDSNKLVVFRCCQRKKRNTFF